MTKKLTREIVGAITLYISVTSLVHLINALNGI